MSKKTPPKTTKKVDTTEKMSWDMLVEQNKEVNNLLVGQTLMVNELTNLYIDDIKKDKELLDLVKGLRFTLYDIANAIREISLLHATLTTERTLPSNDKVEVAKTFKSGDINGDNDPDSYMECLAISVKYIEVEEMIVHAISNNYVNIFTKLKVDVELKEKFQELLTDMPDVGKIMEEVTSKKD